jgi:gas vesicle protein
MNDDRGPGSSGVILSFLLGGLTGAALAILFAPRSGRETREMLGERLRDTAERGRDFRERVVSRGREILDDAEQFVHDQRENIEKQRERLSAAVEAGRQAYREEKAKS